MLKEVPLNPHYFLMFVFMVEGTSFWQTPNPTSTWPLLTARKPPRTSYMFQEAADPVRKLCATRKQNGGAIDY